MGFIGSVFSNDKGAGYQAQGTDLVPAADQGQFQNAYNYGINGLGAQGNFLAALNAQNGIGNQSSVFNQQQGLANQLQDQALGNGPNPALAQLANTTGQNVAQQQALMGSQRGASQNAGLIARQAGQQGAQIQQGAAGQAAVLRAQQQLAAQQALQNQQYLMGNLASQQVGQQGGALHGYNQAAQGLYGLGQQNLQNQNTAIANQNQGRVAMQSNINNANAGIANTNAQGQQQFVGGAINGLARGIAGMAEGGMVPASDNSPESFLGRFTSGYNSAYESPRMGNAPAMQQGGQAMGKGLGSAFSSPASSSVQGYQMPQMGSQFSAGAGGAPSLGAGAMAFEQGGQIPGQAQVKGNSLENDQVPAMLSPGEVVIPRTVMQSKDPAKEAQKFVAALLARKKLGK